MSKPLPDGGIRPRPEPEILLMHYPEMPWSDDLPGWGAAFGQESLNGHRSSEADAAPVDAAGIEARQRAEVDAQWLGRLADEVRRAGEKGRLEGFELGRKRGAEDSSHSLREAREALQEQGAALAEAFAEERARYFHMAEEELVRLALSVAARILRREAQMDPLLLTGAVRVALGQLAQSTSVRLHVPAADHALWKEAFARLPNLAMRPDVIAEPEMQLGECRLETELGSADLSLWAQLKEIERGFFDRVAARAPAEEAVPHVSSSGRKEGGQPASQPPQMPAVPAAARASAPAGPQAFETAAPGEDAIAGSEAAMAAAYNEREW